MHFHSNVYFIKSVKQKFSLSLFHRPPLKFRSKLFRVFPTKIITVFLGVTKCSIYT